MGQWKGTGAYAPSRKEGEDEDEESGKKMTLFHGWTPVLWGLLGGFAGKEGFGVLFEVVEEEAEGAGGVAEVGEDGAVSRCRPGDKMHRYDKDSR